MPFRTFGLETGILRALEKSGYVRPTPIQSTAIPVVIQGIDLIAIAKTGTGKTAAFVLPILHRLSQSTTHGTPKALILAPTRELAVQITDNIQHYGQHLKLRVAAIYGGVEEEEQIQTLRKGAHIIVATPGRLIALIQRQAIDFRSLEALVLDEADRMLHMGFLPDIETILQSLPKHRQTLMFSATISRDIESLARKFLYKPKRIQIGDQTDPAETVRQSIYEVPAHLKGPMLLELLKQPKFSRVLVFVRMKDGANRLTEFLQAAQIKVAKLHSSRTQEQRLKALQDFKIGTARVLVATDIVARGIDIDGVSHVINYDFPVNPEDYVHRIGRTGRADAQGEAISFVPRGDLNLLDHLELFMGVRIPRKRLHGFDYHARSPEPTPGAQPPRQDWRKRTRERDAKKAANERPKAGPHPPKKGGKKPI